MNARRTTSRPARILAVAAALVVALGACGDDDGDTADDTGTEAAEDAAAADDAGAETADGDVVIEGFAFEAASPVAAGTELTVVNRDGVLHTFTADDGAFDQRVEAGATEAVTVPSEPGTYAFHCEIHPTMEAELVVE